MSLTPSQTSLTPPDAISKPGARVSDIDEILALRQQATALMQRLDGLMSLLQVDQPEHRHDV